LLAYHNVVPAGSPRTGDSSLHLPLDRFQRQLDFLELHFQVVPLSKVISGDTPGGRPMAVVSFDDAYRGALKLGIQELARRGLPATLFVSPGLLGRDGFWWDRLAEPTAGEVPPPVRQHALSVLAGRQDEILSWADSLGKLADPLPELYRPSTEQELSDSLSLPGLEVGSHSWSHPNLVALPEGEVREEANRSMEWLQGMEDGRVNCLAYPYGSWTKALARVTSEVGYEAAVRVDGGPAKTLDFEKRRFFLPRLNIPRGLSHERFQARVSGMWWV
jgi:peptidoglycan/xylan/chitin deacetylase (PgdA/CDA1 family)